MGDMINTIVWAAILQGLLLGIMYSTSRKYNVFANRLLGGFLFALVAEALTIFLPFDQISGYSLSGYFSLPEVKLFFPLLFTHFVLEKVGQSARYRTFLRLHYTLAFTILGFTLMNVLVYLITGFPIRNFTGSQLLSVVFMAQQTYAFLLTIVAFTIAVRSIQRYRRTVENEYSDFTMLEINWLWQFVFIMLPITLLWGGELLRIALGGKGGESDVVMINWGLLVIFIYFVSYKAFRHPNLFADPPDATETKTAPEPSKSEEGTDLEDLAAALQRSMAEEKHFLDQELNIYGLAQQLSVSPRLVSTAINRYIGCNFSEWVNNYRVEEALQKLEDPHHQHLSIEGIGLDSGFKSRSAMYTAFKKKTGQTPGHFRQMELS